VGGGPAGMSAACAATLRGHEVSLFEQRDLLGGQFGLAPKAPHKESMSRPLAALVARTMRLVDDVHMSAELAVDDAARFDHIIVATGSRQRIPKIDGLTEQNWMTSLEFFEGKRTPAGPRILVIGAGMVGMEAAELLLSQGHEVVATKRGDTIANDMELVTKKLMLKRLDGQQGITLMPETTVLAFEGDGVQVSVRGERRKLSPFDTVLVASGMLPDRELVEDLQAAGIAHTVVGDAGGPADIYAATRAGYEVARGL